MLLVGPTEVPQWPYWTYLVNFAIAERNQFLHGVLDIAWSLAIEEQFYVVWAGGRLAALAALARMAVCADRRRCARLADRWR